MPHELTVSRRILEQIDFLLPRLKYSVLPSQIVKWLENFDENEVRFAFDLLSVFEYIPFNEFMFRLNDLFADLVKNIPLGEKIMIFPYGKVGKSGTLVTYPLKNTETYKGRESDIIMTHDFENIKNPASVKHLVFLDDFIGSGHTFNNVLTKKNGIKEWIEKNQVNNIYILACVIMNEGKQNINKPFPEIKIFSEVRNKIFIEGISPLQAFGTFDTVQKISNKYDNEIESGFVNGYNNSQSLISFFHCTPDNTLPTIWSNNKWNPLYPRKADIRMDEAREFKKSIAFYIGICNKLGIDLFTGRTIIEEKNGYKKREVTHNNKQDHSIVALLVLIQRGLDIIVICHLLGLTRSEIKDVYRGAKELGFIDNSYNINLRGTLFLKTLKARTKKEIFRKETKENLELKSVLYLPKTFRGMA